MHCPGEGGEGQEPGIHREGGGAGAAVGKDGPTRRQIGCHSPTSSGQTMKHCPTPGGKTLKQTGCYSPTSSGQTIKQTERHSPTSSGQTMKQTGCHSPTSSGLTMKLTFDAVGQYLVAKLRNKLDATARHLVANQ